LGSTNGEEVNFLPSEVKKGPMRWEILIIVFKYLFWHKSGAIRLSHIFYLLSFEVNDFKKPRYFCLKKSTWMYFILHVSCSYEKFWKSYDWKKLFFFVISHPISMKLGKTKVYSSIFLYIKFLELFFHISKVLIVIYIFRAIHLWVPYRKNAVIQVNYTAVDINNVLFSSSIM
jgi:hypothetical protein